VSFTFAGPSRTRRPPRGDLPDSSPAQPTSPHAGHVHDGRASRSVRTISVGSVVGWGIVTMLAALVLFVGFCAIPGLKSSAEDDDRRPGGGADVGKPQTR
jgi:hypothetical protein